MNILSSLGEIIVKGLRRISMHHSDTRLNGSRRVSDTSDNAYSAVFEDFNKLHILLKSLREDLPALANLLHLDGQNNSEDWMHVLDSKLLPQTNPDFPLMIAVCGGGSSGKSTLFNSLLGKDISVVGGTAGLSRRVLVAANPALVENEAFMSNLFHPFGCVPRKLESKKELTEPGPPVYVADSDVPPHVILVDTPDFDTGHDDAYSNRSVVKPVLQAANLLVYIFTNATYRNLANTQFIAKMLTETGQRKAVLIYRAYDHYALAEVKEHSQTVARNIYGDVHSSFVLACYRTSDSNAVASGKEYMQLQPVEPTVQPFNEFISHLDPRQMRGEELAIILKAFRRQTKTMCDNVRLSHDRLALYNDMVRLSESHAAADALKGVPVEAIMQRVMTIWKETSPKTLKVLRGISGAVKMPFEMLLGTARWSKNKLSGEDGAEVPDTPHLKVKENLNEAANELRRRVLSDSLSAETTETDADGGRMIALAKSIMAGATTEQDHPVRLEPCGNRPGSFNIYVRSHAALEKTKECLSNKPWEPITAELEAMAAELDSLPEDLDAELRTIVDGYRASMGFWKKRREELFASLSVLPTLIAVTYVVCTCEPAGGAGIWVKLHGLFGLNDLYALAAIPASTGLSAIERKKMEALLNPAYAKWFQLRSRKICELLRKCITGSVIECAEKILAKVESKLKSVARFEDACHDNVAEADNAQ